EAEAGHGAEVLVEVVLGALAAQHGDEVLREYLRLTDGVLGVRHAVAADATTRQVGDGRDVTGGPGTLDGGLGGSDAQVGTGLDAAALLDGQVAAAHDGGVGHDARGPDDQVGGDDLSGRQLDVAVDGAGHLG